MRSDLLLLFVKLLSQLKEEKDLNYQLSIYTFFYYKCFEFEKYFFKHFNSLSRTNFLP